MEGASRHSLFHKLSRSLGRRGPFFRSFWGTIAATRLGFQGCAAMEGSRRFTDSAKSFEMKAVSLVLPCHCKAMVLCKSLVLYKRYHKIYTLMV